MQPTSLLGSGFIEEETDPMEQASMLAPQGGMSVSMMAAPPPPPVSPGLAAGSGMLAGLTGQQGNPYLAQQAQQQQLSIQSGQNNQAIKLLEMKQRAELARKTQETKKNELLFKVAEGALKSDDPTTKMLGARTFSQGAKSVLGIDIPAEHLLGGQTSLKDKEREDIDGILDRAIRSGAPDPSAAFAEVVSIYPGVPQAYLKSRMDTLRDPIARRVVLGKDKDGDPVALRLEQNAKLVTDFQKSNPAFKDDKKYAISNFLYQRMTVNPMHPDGRHLHTADVKKEAPLLEFISNQSDQMLLQQEALKNGLNQAELSQRIAAMQEEVRQGKRPANDPELIRTKEQYNLVAGPIVSPPFGGIANRAETLAPTPQAPQAQATPAAATQPGPLNPKPGGIAWIQKPTLNPEQAGATGNMLGTPVDDAIAEAQKSGRTPLNPSQREKIDAAESIDALLDGVEKDIKGLNKIRTPVERFTGAPERYFAIQGQKNPDAAAAYSRIEGALSRLARAIGQESGALSNQDVDRARNLWPILTPALRFGVIGGSIGNLVPVPEIPDTDEVVAKKFKGLRELVKDIKNRTGLPPGAVPFKGDPVAAITGKTPQAPSDTKAPQALGADKLKSLKAAGYTDAQIEAYKKLKGMQ
jgi:hypothetical protein